MKQVVILLLLLAGLKGFSQSPPYINYQGVARTTSGSVLANHTLGIKFEILQGSSSGTAIFTETQSGIGTNALGLFSTQIGKNSSLSSVTWANGSYYLRVSIDTTGTSGFTTLGTQQLVSVPYALNAPAPSVSYSNNVLSVGNNTVLLPSGGSSSPSLSINGNTLSITTGTDVVIPTTTVTGTGAAVVSSTAANTFNVNTPSVTISSIFPYGYGLLTVQGSYPNYQISAIVTGSYASTTGVLSISNALNPVNTSTIDISPYVNLSGPNLTIGSTTVNLNPVAPWRFNQANSTVTLATSSASVGIGASANPPTANLHVDGYTRLGNLAPAMAVRQLTANTSGSGNITSFTFSSFTTASKILSVSVMVEMTTGQSDWIHENYTNAAGYQFNWKVNNGTNAVEVTPLLANSSSIATGHQIKVLITYEAP